MGKGGKEFSFLKFRTMILGADDMLEKLKPLSEREGPVFKMKNDPRITRVGKFLRKYSLDELPQLFNVLRGDMSLVGPRPQVLWEAAYYDEWAKRRLQVMPGITGLWQVSGRTALSYDEMIRLDLYYIENWSFELDLKILLQTFLVIIRGEGM
jgi:lipopolysaccharide/colanic/teichoic acid biosynthesis glycosyltransferase